MRNMFAYIRNMFAYIINTLDKYKKIAVIMAAATSSLGLGTFLIGSGLIGEALFLFAGNTIAVGYFLHYDHQEKLYESQIEENDGIQNESSFDFEETEDERERYIYEKNQKSNCDVNNRGPVENYDIDDALSDLYNLSDMLNMAQTNSVSDLNEEKTNYENYDEFDTLDETIISFFEEDYQESYQKSKKIH